MRDWQVGDIAFWQCPGKLVRAELVELVKKDKWRAVILEISGWAGRKPGQELDHLWVSKCTNETAEAEESAQSREYKPGDQLQPPNPNCRWILSEKDSIDPALWRAYLYDFSAGWYVSRTATTLNPTSLPSATPKPIPPFPGVPAAAAPDKFRCPYEINDFVMLRLSPAEEQLCAVSKIDDDYRFVHVSLNGCPRVASLDSLRKAEQADLDKLVSPNPKLDKPGIKVYCQGDF